MSVDLNRPRPPLEVGSRVRIQGRRGVHLVTAVRATGGVTVGCKERWYGSLTARGVGDPVDCATCIRARSGESKVVVVSLGGSGDVIRAVFRPAVPLHRYACALDEENPAGADRMALTAQCRTPRGDALLELRVNLVMTWSKYGALEALRAKRGPAHLAACGER